MGTVSLLFLYQNNNSNSNSPCLEMILNKVALNHEEVSPCPSSYKIYQRVRILAPTSVSGAVLVYSDGKFPQLAPQSQAPSFLADRSEFFRHYR